MSTWLSAVCLCALSQLFVCGPFTATLDGHWPGGGGGHLGMMSLVQQTLSMGPVYMDPKGKLCPHPGPRYIKMEGGGLLFVHILYII